MARTIGKVAIRKVQGIAQEEARRKIAGAAERAESIIQGTHPEYYDTWESAWSEIQRVIDDAICDIVYGRK